MFGLGTLEVAIGIVFVFTLLNRSVLCSTIGT
jgi:hypothetical protein